MKMFMKNNAVLALLALILGNACVMEVWSPSTSIEDVAAMHEKVLATFDANGVIKIWRALLTFQLRSKKETKRSDMKNILVGLWGADARSTTEFRRKVERGFVNAGLMCVAIEGNFAPSEAAPLIRKLAENTKKILLDYADKYDQQAKGLLPQSAAAAPAPLPSRPALPASASHSLPSSLGSPDVSRPALPVVASAAQEASSVSPARQRPPNRPVIGGNAGVPAISLVVPSLGSPAAQAGDEQKTRLKEEIGVLEVNLPAPATVAEECPICFDSIVAVGDKQPVVVDAFGHKMCKSCLREFLACGHEQWIGNALLPNLAAAAA